MIDIGRSLLEIQAIENKYKRSTDGLWNWIQCCVCREERTPDALWFHQCLVTFVPEHDAELFNIAAYCDKTAGFLCDKTLLLKPFLIKNFGVDTLDELHDNTVCAPEDIRLMVSEIEWEISGFF